MSLYFMHVVNTTHRNLITLRRFMYDVLLIESHGTSFARVFAWLDFDCK